jgi:N-acetylmuramoyl-L-alanine amidase CwlD
MIRRRKTVIWLHIPGWWRIALASILVLAAMAAYGKNMPEMRTWTSWSMPLSGMVIAIDPGHGGIDGGAVSKDGIIEKNINLAIALVLRDYLQQVGAYVVMTREIDDDLADIIRGGRQRQDLERRVKRVNDSGADLLVSIHMNSVPSSRYRGAQTFYQPNVHPESRRLAEMIQTELIRQLQNTDRAIVPRDNIFLLNHAQMPAVLVEVGFLSHPEEAGLLATDSYQRKVAEAIYRGILRYAAGEKTGESRKEDSAGKVG